MSKHDVQKEFGIFRSLCQDPDAWSWKKLCGYLDRWEYDWEQDVFQEMLLPYLRDQLGRWPAELPRFAQHHWVEYGLKGRDVPQLEFCTAMQFVSQELDPRRIRKLLKSEHLRSITFLDLCAAHIDREFTAAIAATSTLPNLEQIQVPARHFHKYPSELISKIEARGITFTHPG